MPIETLTPPSAAPADELLDQHEVAAILRVAIPTLQDWRWKGEGPRFVKLGKRVVRYRRADIEAFVEAGSHGGAS